MPIIESAEGTPIIDYASVEVTHINDLPSHILARTGKRNVAIGDVGVVRTISVPGFDSDAILVELRDPWGEKTGRQCVLFPGEYKRIPDLTPPE